VNRLTSEIYRDYNRAENSHDLVGTTRLLAPDLKVKVNGVAQLSSAADDEIAMNILYRCYPDYHREIVQIIESGDVAVVVWRMKGTPSKSHGDIPDLSVEGVSVVKGNGSVLTEASLYADSSALEHALALAHEEPRSQENS
jgi:hypothetical protein